MITTLDNTQAHCAQLHTNDRHRAEAYADRMQSLGYRVTTPAAQQPAKRGTVYTVTVRKCGTDTVHRVTLAPLIKH